MVKGRPWPVTEADPKALNSRPVQTKAAFVPSLLSSGRKRRPEVAWARVRRPIRSKSWGRWVSLPQSCPSKGGSLLRPLDPRPLSMAASLGQPNTDKKAFAPAVSAAWHTCPTRHQPAAQAKLPGPLHMAHAPGITGAWLLAPLARGCITAASAVFTWLLLCLCLKSAFFYEDTSHGIEGHPLPGWSHLWILNWVPLRRPWVCCPWLTVSLGWRHCVPDRCVPLCTLALAALT